MKKRSIRSWIPPGHKRTMADFPSFDKVFPDSAIAELAREYAIPEDQLTRLRSWLTKAHGFYYTEHLLASRDPGRVADRRTAANLADKVAAVVNGFRDPEMADRLKMASAVLFPGQPPNFVFVVNQVEELLLPIAHEAARIDGRAVKGRRQVRVDARTAAAALHKFWADVLGRPPALQDRGGRETKALRFVLDCLRLLDPKIKASAIRDLYAD